MKNYVKKKYITDKVKSQTDKFQTRLLTHYCCSSSLFSTPDQMLLLCTLEQPLQRTLPAIWGGGGRCGIMVRVGIGRVTGAGCLTGREAIAWRTAPLPGMKMVVWAGAETAAGTSAGKRRHFHVSISLTEMTPSFLKPIVYRYSSELCQ